MLTLGNKSCASVTKIKKEKIKKEISLNENLDEALLDHEKVKIKYVSSNENL